MAAKSGVVVEASAAACWLESVGNWLSGVSSPPLIRPVGSRSDTVSQPAVPKARLIASVAITNGRA